MDENQDKVFDDAYDLYQEIRDERGLHLRDGNGRDDIVYQELQASIGCGNETIADYLREADHKAEWLLKKFLELAAPFAQMFVDIWDFLSTEGAPEAEEDLRIQFGFNDDSTEVDLEEFREYADMAREISIGVTVAQWSDEAVSELFELAKQIDVERDHNQRYHPGESYTLPEIETVHGDTFETYLRRIRSLYQHAIDRLAQKDGQRYLFGVDEPESQRPRINLPDCLPAWVPIFKNHEAVSRSDREQAVAYFEAHIEPKLELDTITASMEYESPLDILRLPFWEHRWHTYEIWMSVQTLKALDKCGPEVRTEDNRIPLDGREKAVVADLENTHDPETCVASELRTSYDTHRREAIQPDLSISSVDDIGEEERPVTIDQLNKESRIVIVEYKQQLSLGVSYAEKIADDYLGGSPKAAGLIMVNYDAPAAADFPDEAEMIGNVRPGAAGLDRYQAAISEYIQDIGYKPPTQEWTVLVDVSRSMGEIYKEYVMKEKLLELADTYDSVPEMYTFTSGLTDSPQITTADIESGIETTNGTEVRTATKEVLDEYETRENLLVITDVDDPSLGPLGDEFETVELWTPDRLKAASEYPWGSSE